MYSSSMKENINLHERQQEPSGSPAASIESTKLTSTQWGTKGIRACALIPNIDAVEWTGHWLSEGPNRVEEEE